MNKNLLYLILFLCLAQITHSQENGLVALDLPIRNSLKFNKYAVNPTFSFVREQNKYISLTNKQQWVQFDNAPQSFLFSYSGRFTENIGAGIGLFQQDYGVQTVFGGIVNFAYNTALNRDNNLTFGLNIGAYQSGINEANVITNFSDPVLQNMPKHFLITINPAINYGTTFFDFGITANNLVSYNLNVSKIIEDNPEQSFQAHIMYTGYMDSRGFFDESKFSTLIRSEFKKETTVISGLVMLSIPKGIWGQIGYNSLYGASAGVGINVSDQIALEYNYEQSVGELSGFGNSHEFTLAYRFKNNNRYVYSNDDEEVSVFQSSRRKRTIANRSSNSKPKINREEVARLKAEEIAKRKEVLEQKRLAREEAERIRKEEKELVASKDQENKEILIDNNETDKLEKTQNAKEEAERLVLERKKQEEEEKIKAERELQEKRDAEATARAEELKRKQIEEEKLRLDAIKRKEEEEARAKAERELQEKEEAEAIARAEELKRKQLEEEVARAKAERELQEKEEAEAIARAEELKRKQLEEEKSRLDTIRRKEEEEAKVLEIARLKAEAEEAAKLESERLKAEEEKTRQNEDLVAMQSELDEETTNSINNINQSAKATKEAQNTLIDRLTEKVAIKQKDLEDLKEENDLSEQGIYVAPKPFKSVSAENAEIETLKEELDKTIEEQRIRIEELEAVLVIRKRKVRDNKDPLNAVYLKAIEELKTQQLNIIQAKANLEASLITIKEATDIERKRRIKRAAYDNQQDRFKKDSTSLANIKRITEVSTVALSEADFDFGEEPSNNIRIVKNVDHAKSGYYMVIAVHEDEAKRDEFLSKVVSSGRKDVNFFFDVNTNKYFIYYQQFNAINQAQNALEVKGNEPYNNKMSIVKIEN
ncbi:PorP/SprF family type IX secretion system membrane protein [Seonamhaeicola sp. MEBiC1930]|uniref:PorP/SprF family type IX secretion system membrane protein n=1 Tax=Seonamhaeicola sp. MEBiC01930 TaxID=2976768 RepID=UPI00324519D9